jgi:hypothetical protein
MSKEASSISIQSTTSVSPGILSGVVLAILLLAAGLPGCTDPEKSPPRTAGHTGNENVPWVAYGTEEDDTVRVRADIARSRLWVLGTNDVSVYDTSGSSIKLVRQIVLPDWSVARFVCEPDIVLDGSGSAIIAGNVPSRLWTIDGESFEVKRHDIMLQGREQWDIGFGALAFAVDGTLVALTSSANSSWKIDIETATASMIETYLPPLAECALPAQSLSRPERSPKP